MKKQIVLHKGGKFTSPGGGSCFYKDVVKVGRWVHPLTKQEIVFTPERIEKLARNTEKFLEAGNRIPFPKGHTTDPTKNLGYWPGPFMPFGDSLIGVVEPKDPVALEAMKNGTLDAVSVCIEFDVTDAKQNKYDEVITHVCATSYPVLDGQKGFMALSLLGAEGTHVPEELSGLLPEGDKSPMEEKEMTTKEMALALGLPEAASDADILKAALNARKANDEVKVSQDAAKLAQEATKGVESKLSKVAEQLAANGFKLEGEKLVRVQVIELDVLPKEGDSDELKAFKANEAKRREAEGLARAGANKEYVLAMAKNLELPPALQGLAQEVLGVKGALEALTLSTDGKGVDMKKLEDFPAKMRTLLDGIIKAKPVKGAPMTTLGTDRRKDSEALDKKGREELAKSVVDMVQPEAAGKK
jgi:hypothetical protein